MIDTSTEWVQLDDHAIVVATAAGACLHRPAEFGVADPFLEPMRKSGTSATTRALLDGVIAVAQRAAPATPVPAMSLARWAWRLAGYYHTTHATPILMAEAARRFAALGRPELAAYASGKVADEGGHDELALRDLRALGLVAEAVVERWIPPTAAALVDYFTRLAHADFPLGVLGYAYALERLALAADRDYVAKVEAVLPAGVYATRCLRVHSALGADAGHTDDLISVAAGLPATERIHIARACHATAKLCCAPPPGASPSEAALAAELPIFSTTANEVSRPQ
jgi:hypothetical protein